MTDLKIVKGNAFETIVEIRAYDFDGKEIIDFDLRRCANLRVRSYVRNSPTPVECFEILDEHTMSIWWDRSTKLGQHYLEAAGKFNGVSWRFQSKEPIFTIVKENEDSSAKTPCKKGEDRFVVRKQKIFFVGPQGPKGDKGDIGETGPLGIQGEKGDKGTSISSIEQTKTSYLSEGVNEITIRLDDGTSSTFEVRNGQGDASQDWVEHNYYTKDQVDNVISSAVQTESDRAQLAESGLSDRLNTQEQNTTQQFSTKVDKVQGKGLSQNDFTDQLKSKLEGIQYGAEINVQSDWAQQDSAKDSYIKNKPTNVSSFNNDVGYLTEHLDISGKQDVISDLNTIREGAAAGATAYQLPNGGIPKIDLDTSVLASLDSADSAYQLPSGGIPENDLSQTVKSKLSAGNTAYQKPSNGIPKSDLSQSVLQSLELADSALQSHQDISGKADKVSGATDGNFAGLDVNGNITDSGHKHSDYKTKQSSVSDPNADGTGLTFIDSVSLDTNGVITPHKKTVQNVSTQQAGIMSAQDKLKLDGLNIASSADDNNTNLLTTALLKSSVLDLIPSLATSSNKLADKNFVNSSVSTATAEFKGTYNLKSDLELNIEATLTNINTKLKTKISTADNNDYVFILIPTANNTPTEISQVDKYKFNGTNWLFEYTLNNSGFTAALWLAINSGVTSSVLLDISQNKSDKSSTVSNVSYSSKKLTQTINESTTDIVNISTIKTDLELTKSDVGLGNVGNFKAVSTEASLNLTSTEKSNARTNIGAGTSSLALGETSSTAYRGDRGKTAYTHSTDSNRLTTAKLEGLYKIATTVEGHIKSATAVEKSDITGLGIPADDTHYTATPILGASSATSNSTTDTTNAATYLNIVENNTKSGGVQIKGTGATTVKAKNGLLTITSTDLSVSSSANHYTPEANVDSELTASLSETAGTYAKDTEYTVLTGVKAQRDAKGHVTGLTYTALKIKDTNNTYTGYNIVFKNNAGTTVDTYKPLTSPSKTFKAGTNVEMSADSNVITISATDTKNTAGSTNKVDTKLFLVGATSQAANPQTYSNVNVYVGTDNCLYSNGTKVLTSHQSLSNYVTLDGAQTITGKKTFSGTAADLLTVDRNSGTSTAWVRFMKDGALSGYLGVTPTHVAQFHNGTSAYTIWHSGNDGASSGLDADLLDGQHGSYYAAASDVTTLQTDVSTLQGRFDSSGNANSALKLTTVSKTAWGQTYWTSGGVPTNISGNMTDVGNIYLGNAKYIYSKNKPAEGEDAVNYILLGLNTGNNFLIGYGNADGTSYDTYIYGNNIRLYYSSSRSTGLILNSSGDIGIGITSPSYKLHVAGTFRASGNSSIGGTLTMGGDIDLGGNSLILTTATSSWTNSDRSIPFGVNADDSKIKYYYTDSNKGLTFNPSTGELKAGSFIKRGGTSSQFLKADGSIDSNTYLTSVAFNSITSTPTTLDGYGITDAYTKTESDTGFFRLNGGISLGASSSNPVSIDGLISPNNYYQNATAGVPYITTLPEGITQAFRLWVGNYFTGQRYIFQRIQQYSDTNVYERYSSTSTTSWSNWYLVQDNLANYLSLSGGTMTGCITTSVGNNSYTSGKGIDIGSVAHIGSSSAGNAGFYATGSIAIRPNSTMYSSSTNGLLVSDSSFTYNGYTVWRTDNDGSGSGMDADLLDGTHKSDLFSALSNSGTTISVTIGGTNKTLTVDYATQSNNLYAGQILSGNTSGDANTMQLDGEGSAYSVLTNYHGNSKWLNVPSNAFTSTTYGGIIELKGVDANLKMQFAWAALHNEVTSPTNGLWFRARANKGYSATDWHQVAMTDSNVASATTLQTSRTLWGQSFNGSANVSGDMTDVGNITMSGNLNLSLGKGLTTYYQDGYYSMLGMWGGNYNLVHLNYYLANSKSIPLHLYGNAIRMYSKVNGTLTQGFVLDTNGNVGIGTTSPANLLDVNGTIGLMYNGTVTAKMYCPDATKTAIEGPSSGYLYLGLGTYSTLAVMLSSTNFKPLNANTGVLDLGTSSARWKGIYGTTLNISSTSTFGEDLNITGVVNASSHTSSATNTTKGINLGTVGHIGAATSYGLGLYSTGSIYIRPNVTLGSSSSNGIVLDNTSLTYSGNIIIGDIPSGTCSTAVGTKAKTVSITGYTLSKGNIIKVTFTKGNTVTNATLNVTTTGAKTIVQYNGSALASDTIAANDVVTLLYDGTYYRILGINSIFNTSIINSPLNGYVLGAACEKEVVTSIDTSASLPTSNAVKTFVEGKGYIPLAGGTMTGMLNVPRVANGVYTITNSSSTLNADASNGDVLIVNTSVSITDFDCNLKPGERVIFGFISSVENPIYVKLNAGNYSGLAIVPTGNAAETYPTFKNVYIPKYNNSSYPFISSHMLIVEAIGVYPIPSTSRAHTIFMVHSV